MVYLKLNPALYTKISQFIRKESLVTCQKEYYIPYPQFKRIATDTSYQLHKEINRKDILTYTQMNALIQRQKQTPQQRRLIEQLNNKRQIRLLRNMSGKNQDYYFQNKGQGNSIKEMSDTVSFSLAFIFSFFMAGLTGYYVGAYFLGWDLVSSLMLSLAFIIFTIIIETTLFILRQEKNSVKNKAKKQVNKTNKTNPLKNMNLISSSNIGSVQTGATKTKLQ